ncbi:SLC13 family permease [Aquimarina brevivitae]|uniref:Di/tricarboxylate transporter n=1 Tax=Aquimarina brevivitae TaxID=323412 RepID=A0A4Q7PIR8_9FLAO|nr:SLC13 family permease [Aquimarina brevivitae]RZT00158.1 di/tricarboxylate transporter [Aquimarina brevivitae]
MGIDAYITLGVMLVATILFITEKVSVDVISLGMIVVLVLSGVITTQQGLKGFANEAVLTVMAMFVLSAAIINTNIIERIGPSITRFLKLNYAISISGLAALVGTMSAFVNNTPVVATFIPVLSKSAKKSGLSASRFLIPLSFVAMFGGMCTLIGTSTNLLVSGISAENGFGEFSMFLLAPLGVIFAIVGVVYLILFGKKLIPEREELTEDENRNKIDNFLTEIRYTVKTNEAVPTIENVFNHENNYLEILRVKRGIHETETPKEDFELEEGDVLLVRGDLQKIRQILKSDNLFIVDRFAEKKFPKEATKLIELILQSNSDILRKKIKDIEFNKRFNANILAIRQRGESKFEDLGNVMLKSGDVLLVQTDETGYNAIMEHQKMGSSPFLIFRETPMRKVKKKDLLLATLTILSVILTASLGIVSIGIAALAGIVFLAVTNVITMEDAYKNIDWQVIFLLAGALSLERAMAASGVSELIGYFLVDQVGEAYGPYVVVSVLYLLTSILTGVISNNAAAALFAPIGIAIAEGLHISATPLLVAIAFAGSASFFSPIGYQTNTMVYSAGNYQFKDFIRIGLPLNVLFWLLATVLIPVFYPF